MKGNVRGPKKPQQLFSRRVCSALSQTTTETMKKTFSDYFQRYQMLWAIIALLCVVWLVSVVLKFFVGGLIHLLLVVAVIAFVYNLIAGRGKSGGPDTDH